MALESVALRRDLFEELGDFRKNFYIAGLEELFRLYKNKGMIEESRDVEAKIKEVKKKEGI